MNRGPRRLARRALTWRAFAPFRHAAYRRLAVALVLQTFATGMWTIAIVWEVIRLGGGANQLSVVAAAGALGMVVPALLGGVVADRIPQKSILLAVTLTQCAAMSVVALLSLSDHNTVLSLALVALVIGFATAFYYPAYNAWLPALVPADDLMAVNGFEGAIRPALLQALGPAVAGGIVAALNPGAAVLLAAVVSAAGVFAFTAVPQTPVRRDVAALAGGPPVAGAWRDLREGVAFMVRTPWLLASLLFASVLVFCVMGPLEVLLPFLIKDELGGGPRDHAWVLAAFGVGAALGAFAVGSVRMPRRYLTIMLLTWGFGVIPMSVMAFAGQIGHIVVLAFVVGILFDGPMVIWGTLLQRRVPSELLGRVSSLDFFVSLVFMPVSMAAAGPVAHALGLRTTFVVAGIVPVVLAVVCLLVFRLDRDEVAHPLA